MQQIVTFFIKYKNFIFFLLLLSVSLSFFLQSHYFHRTKLINSANWLTGNVYSVFNTIDEYFSLRKNNRILVEENRKLRETLYNRRNNNSVDSFFLKNYEIITAKVIKNSFSNPKNYLTLNRGTVHGVVQDMGVITSNGILGIVEKSSKHFSLVQSVLNMYSEINAKVKRTNHFGSLKWNAKNYEKAQLVDVPRLADIKKGDTIITGGMSAIFPEGIPIGIIENFRLDSSQNYFSIDVVLFTDMTNVEYVYIIKSKQKKELLDLQQAVENE